MKLFTKRGVSKTISIIVTIVVVIAIIGGLAGYLATRQAPVTPTIPTETTPTSTPLPSTTIPTIPPTVERVLRIGGTWPVKLDPAIAYDYISLTAVKELYDTLFRPTSQGYIPWLVTKYDIKEDGLVWILELRKGVKFHTGRELTAKDVEFSFKRVMILKTGFAGTFGIFIKNITATDTYTVKVELKEPCAILPALLARLYVLDSEEVMKHIKSPGPYGEYGDFATEWLSTYDAGSGPYMVAEVKLGEYAKFVKFPDYWNKNIYAPNSPSVVYIYPTAGNPTGTLAMLSKRELEISDQWQSEEFYMEADNIKYVDIAKIPEPSVLFFMLNSKKPPLDDVHIRRALMYALDYETVLKEIFPGYLPARGSVPPNVPGWCEEIPEIKRNLTKAIEELKKSKYYPDIVNNPDKYVIEHWWTAEVPALERLALLFASNAAELGLKVNVIKQPWSKIVEYMSKLETSPHITTIFITDRFSDAGLYLMVRYHSMFATTFSQNEWFLNKTIDNMIEDAISAIDPLVRQNLLCKIQKMAVDEAWSIAILWQISKFAYQSHYVYWPPAKDPTKLIPVLGYEITWEEIEVYPEKLAEIKG